MVSLVSMVSLLFTEKMKFIKKLFKRAMKRSKKFRSRTIKAMGHMNHVSQPAGLNCPKCSEGLYGMAGRGAGMQLYVCRKCGYQGSIGMGKMQKLPKKLLKSLVF